jgi:transcription initiation factor TFIIH subunit 4
MHTPVRSTVSTSSTRVHEATDNPLQTAVLNLFVTLKSRFPNLVVGQVTRESVKRALANGITAEQVPCAVSCCCPAC